MFSFCIVAIHTNLFLREYPTIYWYSSHVVWRIAVPFFFIASGYFFCKKVKTSNEPNKVLKKTIRRLLTLLVFWLLVSLPLEVRTLIIQGIGSKQLVFELLKKVIFYPWGALWYILALIVSYVLIYPFLRKNNYKIPIIIGSFLFIFGIFANSYYFLIEGTFFQKIIDWYLKNFISSRNGLFLGFFYIAIANYMTVKGEFSRKTNILLLII